MSKKKHKGRRKWLQWKILSLLPAVLLFVVSVSYAIWYESRAVPDLGEQDEMTVIPQEVNRVLGLSVGPSTSPANQLRIPILMYHYVEYVDSTKDPGRANLNIPPNILTAQIETLKSAGYTFITPDDLVPAIVGKKKLPTKVVMLSFDDGYEDFYTEVFPILQKEKVKGVAYIIVNLLDRPNYLFTYQLPELAKSPYVEIGAHTMDHPGLAGMNTKEATYEIAQSRKSLQDLLHVPVNSFAYPYGSFDLQAIQIVKDAGFSNAVSTIPGIEQSKDNLYFLNRLRPGDRTGQSLLDLFKQDAFQPW